MLSQILGAFVGTTGVSVFSSSTAGPLSIFTDVGGVCCSVSTMSLNETFLGVCKSWIGWFIIIGDGGLIVGVRLVGLIMIPRPSFDDMRGASTLVAGTKFPISEFGLSS